ncbi:MAG: tetratricopeptide repeat protein [Ruminococcus sp.]
MELVKGPSCEEQMQDNQVTCTNCGNLSEDDTNTGKNYNRQGVESFDVNNIESYQTAVELFRKSWEMGCAEGQKNLGIVLNLLGVRYYNGDGVEVNLKSAEKCFRESSAIGNEKGKKNLATLYVQYGDIYSNNKKITANPKLAEEYYKEATEYDPDKCKANLIKFYINCYFNCKHGREGFKKDHLSAELYLQKAKSVDSRMVEETGLDYYTKAKKMMSQGVTKENYRRINGYLKRASHLTEKDLTDDLINFYKTVAVCAKKGKCGFKKNNDRSNRYYGKAAALGDPEAIEKYRD